MTFAGVLVLALAAVSGVDRAIRPRVYTLIGAGTAAFVAIQLGLPIPFGVWSSPVLSARPAQAAVLVMGPCLVFSGGLLLIRFNERSTRTDQTTAP